jgi:histidine ammonia-lyase
VLRINAFLNGYSGIRRELVLATEAMVNKGVIPLVPLKGSVGSSGDLAPLAHLFVVFCKEGRESKGIRFYKFLSNEGPPVLEPAVKLEETIGVVPEPSPKEGLALTNGASFAAAMLALAVHDAKEIAVAADIAAAMSAEALLGCARAFDARVHQARAQKGQEESAARIRTMLEGSKLLETHTTVQDPYSIRCAPAVHGASFDALEFGATIARRELNAATDNPLFFPDGEPWDENFRDNWKWRRDDRFEQPAGGSAKQGEPDPRAYEGSKRRSYSAGNFHGQPCAVAADVMAIALSELANISERRTQLLMDKDHNRGLPSNLIPNAGLNSGFMIAQYCAAALVSENKVLAHPASVDSIPTSANSEDHNSMAPIATRKLRTILANARHALAIELLVAAQALEWAALFHRIKTETLPQELQEGAKDYIALTKAAKDKDPSKPLEHRKNAWALGDAEKQLFELWTLKPNRTNIAESLSPGTRAAYLRIREAVEPMIVDRVLADDIRNVAALLAPNGKVHSELIEAVRGAVSNLINGDQHGFPA